MTRVRCVTEIGMGVDVHGRDATKAAKRAVSDAIRHSSLAPARILCHSAAEGHRIQVRNLFMSPPDAWQER